jgi:hypothetical protein
MASFAQSDNRSNAGEYQTLIGLVDGKIIGSAVTSMCAVIAQALPKHFYICKADK